MHHLASNRVVIVSQQSVDESIFIATQCGLAELPRYQFSIAHDHPSIFETHDLALCIALLLALEIDDCPGISVGPQQSRDDLFARPQRVGQDDSRRGQIDHLGCIGEP